MDAIAHGFSEDIPSGVTSAVQGNTQFALDLYRTLRTTPGNLFISPYGISVALAMTYAGARGETATQMASTLHFDLGQQELHPAFAALEARLADRGQQDDVQLHVANRLWPQEGYDFRGAFVAFVQEY